jgi:hypothetical protein
MLRDDVPVSKLDNYGEITGAIQLVQASQPGKITIEGKEYPFCTLVVDTLGEYCRVLERAAKGSSEQATLPQWYLTVERCRNTTRLMRDLRDKGINVVFITHEQYLKEGEINVVQGLPDLPGKELPTDLPKLVDVVAHLRVRPGEKGPIRELVAEPHGFFIGRDRRGLIQGALPIDLKDQAGLQKMLVEKGGAHHNCGG